MTKGLNAYYRLDIYGGNIMGGVAASNRRRNSGEEKKKHRTTMSMPPCHAGNRRQKSGA
jgi:hypothetical protein